MTGLRGILSPKLLTLDSEIPISSIYVKIYTPYIYYLYFISLIMLFSLSKRQGYRNIKPYKTGGFTLEGIGYREINSGVPQGHAGVLRLEGAWRDVRHGGNP